MDKIEQAKMVLYGISAFTITSLGYILFRYSDKRKRKKDLKEIKNEMKRREAKENLFYSYKTERNIIRNWQKNFYGERDFKNDDKRGRNILVNDRSLEKRLKYKIN